MIDTESAARDVVQHWLDANMGQPAGTFHVKAVADVGPIWRAVFGWVGSSLWASAVRVDKATGEAQMDYSPSSKVGPSARDGFTAMMRSAVVPELKRLGFAGSWRFETMRFPRCGRQCSPEHRESSQTRSG